MRPTRPEQVRIILVEWAGYPLYREKVVNGRIVRCGLGRVLENMRRHGPGLAVDISIIINGADDEAAMDEGAAGRESRPALAPIRRLVNRRRLATRMHKYERLPRQHPFIRAVHFRDNQGQDFGAYDLGYQLLRQEGYAGDVLFMNSSLSGPHEHGWLLKYRDQFHRHPNVGLCGIGLNSHDTSDGDGPFAPHVQSYFLYTSMSVLERAVGPRLFDADTRDKLDIIRRGEIGVSARVLNAGYSITSPVFPEFAYRRGAPWAIPWGDLRYASGLNLPVNRI